MHICNEYVNEESSINRYMRLGQHGANLQFKEQITHKEFAFMKPIVEKLGSVLLHIQKTTSKEEGLFKLYKE